MKLLFWSLLILGTIWFLMKRSLGGGNDLTAHLAEQKALQSVGDSALGANQISTGNWPLSELGTLPLTGINIDPLNPGNIFTAANDPGIMPGTPSGSASNPFGLIMN